MRDWAILHGTASASPGPVWIAGSTQEDPRRPEKRTSLATPYVDGDYAHLSSGYVSAHGWGYRGTCPNTKATVTVRLYEYFSDGTWHYQAYGQTYVWRGGGSANWATARLVCEGVALAGWRSLVAVNIGYGGLGLHARPESVLHTLVSRAFDHDQFGAVLADLAELVGIEMAPPMNGLTAAGARPSRGLIPL